MKSCSVLKTIYWEKCKTFGKTFWTYMCYLCWLPMFFTIVCLCACTWEKAIYLYNHIHLLSFPFSFFFFLSLPLSSSLFSLPLYVDSLKALSPGWVWRLYTWICCSDAVCKRTNIFWKKNTTGFAFALFIYFGKATLMPFLKSLWWNNSESPTI